MILVIATKVPLRDVSPITIVWLGFAMGIVVLELAVALRKEFALLGFLGITFHQWLQSNGLKMSEAGTTAWIVATAPVFMALLGIFCSGLAYIAWYDALQALSLVGMGFFLYIEPLIATVVALIVLEESITAASLMGAVSFFLERGWWTKIEGRKGLGVQSRFSPGTNGNIHPRENW